METVYRYYRLEEAPPSGTDFPRPAGNPPVAFLNFYEQRPVEEGRFLAWGELWYERPLAQEVIDRFGLRPSLKNPDQEHKATKPRITEQLAQAGRTVAYLRAARKEHMTVLDQGNDR